MVWYMNMDLCSIVANLLDMTIWQLRGSFNRRSSGQLRWHSLTVRSKGSMSHTIRASMIKKPNGMIHEHGFMSQLWPIYSVWPPANSEVHSIGDHQDNYDGIAWLCEVKDQWVIPYVLLWYKSRMVWSMNMGLCPNGGQSTRYDHLRVQSPIQ